MQSRNSDNASLTKLSNNTVHTSLCTRSHKLTFDANGFKVLQVGFDDSNSPFLNLIVNLS